MNLSDDHPRCSKVGCGDYAAFLLTVYTNIGPKVVPFCWAHCLTIGSIVERLVQDKTGTHPVEP